MGYIFILLMKILQCIRYNVRKSLIDQLDKISSNTHSHNTRSVTHNTQRVFQLTILSTITVFAAKEDALSVCSFCALLFF